MLIHGFGCDSRFWGPQLPALDGYELCVPDLPYHGGPVEGVARTLEGLAEWLAKTHLSSPAVLIGHSLGGMIALQLAREHPAVVEGLALVDSFPSLELNSQHLPGLYHEPMNAQLLAWVERTREGIIAAMPQATYEEIWPSIAAFDARPWLTEIRCPVLGIYGGRGRYGADAAAQLRRDLALDGLHGPVTVRVVPAAGHFVNIECAAEVNRAIVAWLERLPGGTNM